MLWQFPVSSYLVIDNDTFKSFLTSQPPTSKSLANCFSYAHTRTHPSNLLLPTRFSVKSWSFSFILIAKKLSMLGYVTLTFFYCTFLLSGLHNAYYFIILFLQKASDKYSCISPWDFAKYLFLILYSASSLLKKLKPYLSFQSQKLFNLSMQYNAILDYSIFLVLFPSPFLPCLHVEWPPFFTLIGIFLLHILFENALLTLGSYTLSLFELHQ